METLALTVSPAPWCNEARAMLARACKFWPLGGVSDFEMREGNRLFAVRQGAQVGAWFVLRIEHFENGAEGVIVCAAGGLKGVDLVAGITPHIEKMFTGIKAVRYTTARLGLLKKMLAQGYMVSHYTARKALA